LKNLEAEVASLAARQTSAMNLSAAGRFFANF
jgi:hypothetical protein